MYENLAAFYDSFTDDLDREKEARFLENIFLHFGNSGLRALAAANLSGKAGGKGASRDGASSEGASLDGPSRDGDAASYGEERGNAVNGENIDASTLIIDVGCGTGELSLMMSKRGYDVTGLDVSAEMLDVAMKKAEKLGENVLWLCQDMCEMDTYGSYAAMFCLTDGVNHILEKERLCGFFKNARNFIDPGGLLVFDFLPPRYFKRIAREGMLYDTREDGACVWWGEYRRGVIDYEIECFIEQKDSPGEYDRYRDAVTERGWKKRQIKRLLGKCGFRVLQCRHYDEAKPDGGEALGNAGNVRSGRYFVVARRG
ncbi:MAG: class I SAM-dependent methyltransferase [Clostridia bacterium]|nr:class I SAM-dependent methyltransferase [Clostridia bacterium]